VANEVRVAITSTDMSSRYHVGDSEFSAAIKIDAPTLAQTHHAVDAD